MAKKRMSADERMAALHHQCSELSGDELKEAIRVGLGDPSNLVVQIAAETVRENHFTDFADELRIAYERFLVKPVKTDKNCRAKLPLLEALGDQGYDEWDFFLEAMKYRQIEPAYGAEGSVKHNIPPGHEDIAGNVRGAAAFGLVRCRLITPAEIICALVDLLTDYDSNARYHAVRAISGLASQAVVPLLRHKALNGDANLDVTGACLSGLIEADPGRSIDFVGRFLLRGENLAIEAAAALGASRQPRAVEKLIKALPEVDSDVRPSLLLSLGLSRQEIATTYLLGLIENRDNFAKVAIQALAPNRFYGDMRERVAEVVKATDDRELIRVLEEEFRLS